MKSSKYNFQLKKFLLYKGKYEVYYKTYFEIAGGKPEGFLIRL